MNPQPSGQSSHVSDHARWFVEEVQPHERALEAWLHARFPWLQDAEQVAREAVIRLWRMGTAENAAPIRSPKAALFAIARNAAIDQARRREIVEINSVPETEHLAVYDSGPDVAGIVCAREELEFFAEALRRLPRRCRQVVTLTKMFGLTEKEVANRLGISEGTVRTQVIRGMERCHAYLVRHGVKRGKHERS